MRGYPAALWNVQVCKPRYRCSSAVAPTHRGLLEPQLAEFSRVLCDVRVAFLAQRRQILFVTFDNSLLRSGITFGLLQTSSDTVGLLPFPALTGPRFLIFIRWLRSWFSSLCC